MKLRRSDLSSVDRCRSTSSSQTLVDHSRDTTLHFYLAVDIFLSLRGIYLSEVRRLISDTLLKRLGENCFEEVFLA